MMVGGELLLGEREGRAVRLLEQRGTRRMESNADQSCNSSREARSVTYSCGGSPDVCWPLTQLPFSRGKQSHGEKVRENPAGQDSHRVRSPSSSCSAACGIVRSDGEAHRQRDTEIHTQPDRHRTQTDIEKNTEREKEADRAAEAHVIREATEVRRERMCAEKALLREVITNKPSQWAVDQRHFVWAEPVKPPEDTAPGSPPRTGPREGGFHLGTPPVLHASGLATTGGEAESSSTLGSSTPGPRAGKVLQSKGWKPEPNAGHASAPAMRSVLYSPTLFPASSVDILQSNPRIIYMPVALENSQLTKVPNHTEISESSRSKEDGSRSSSSWFEEDHVRTAALSKRKRSSNHKASHRGRPGPPERGEPAALSKDMSLSEGLSDDDLSDDEERGQVVSEKRRKRMLSNRASAQRSRLRRQERLDTLEVLVAELRVENAALARKARNACAAAKKFDEENKMLREQVEKQEALPPSNGNSCDPSDKADHSAVDPASICSPSYIQETPHDRYPRQILASSKSDNVDRPLENSKQDPHRRWNNISMSSMNLTKNAVENLNGTPIPESTECQNMENSMGMNLADICQSEITSLVHASSSEDLEDTFGTDLEQGNQEIDRNLGSRSIDDLWVHGFWPTS